MTVQEDLQRILRRIKEQALLPENAVDEDARPLLRSAAAVFAAGAKDLMVLSRRAQSSVLRVSILNTAQRVDAQRRRFEDMLSQLSAKVDGLEFNAVAMDGELNAGFAAILEDA